jgi:hypothetical protein
MDITDIGPFKKLSTPPEWRRKTLRLPQTNRSDLPVVQLVIPGMEEDLEIGIFYRGKLESQADGENFHALLEMNREIAAAVALSPGEIRSLTRVLNLAGFNQYSFPRHITGYNPDFQLRTAQVLLLNGRPVLKVDGEFKADISTDTYFACVFVEADEGGRMIYELYLRASNKDTYLRALPAFRLIAESIEWID